MLLKNLVEVYEAISRTSSRNEKISLMAEFIEDAPKEITSTLCYLLSGEIPRLDIGWANIWKQILKTGGLKEEQALEVYNKYGGLGKSAEELLIKKPQKLLFERPITIEELWSAFRKISEAKGSSAMERKSEFVFSLLSRASPEESKFIVQCLSGEMRYGFSRALVREAISTAFELDPKEVARADMTTNDIGFVGCMASEGNSLKNLELKPLVPVMYMLCELAESKSEPFKRYGSPVFEYKYDGIRLQIHKLGKNVKIFTRSFEEVGESLPEIVSEIKAIKKDFIIDGELVPFEHVPNPFQLVIKRVRRKQNIRQAAKEIPVKFFAFDLLWFEQKQLLDLTLEKRREILEDEFKPGKFVQISPLFAVPKAKLNSLLRRAINQQGHEGLVAKDPKSYYWPGKRGLGWLKIKSEPKSLDLVVVAVEKGHGKRADMWSDYTFAALQRGNFIPVTKAFTGLTDREIVELGEQFKEICIKEENRIMWVEPKIVCEVCFSEIFGSPQYEHGLSLKFPRIKKIRPDKGPGEIDTIGRIVKMYKMQKRKV